MLVRIQFHQRRKRTNPGKRAEIHNGTVQAPPNNKRCHNGIADAVTATTTTAFITMKSNNNVQNASRNTLTLVEELERARFTLALLKHSTRQVEFEVDFTFVAPSRETADALSAQLKAETNYTVRIDPFVDRKMEYWVEATTPPMTLSQEVLDQCVARMVNYAGQHACVFDGWGTLASLD